MIQEILKDLKKEKFKKLMAHTMSTTALLLPGMIALSMDSLSGALVTGTVLTLYSIQIVALFKKFKEGKRLDRTRLRILNPHIWKVLLDTPIVHLVESKQKELIIKLRKGEIDDSVINHYLDYKMYFLEVSEWEATHHKFMSNHSSFKEIAYKIEELVGKNELRRCLKSRVEERYPLIDLKLDNFDDGYVYAIITSGGYKQLKESDYAGIKATILEGREIYKIFNALFTAPGMVDWPKVKNILIENYRVEDHIYKDIMARINKQLEHIVVPIDIGNDMPSDVSMSAGGDGVAADISNLSQLMTNFKYITTHREELDFKKDVEATLAVIKEAKLHLPDLSELHRENAKNLIEENIKVLLERSVQLRSEIEAEVVKSLVVNKKQLKSSK